MTAFGKTSDPKLGKSFFVRMIKWEITHGPAKYWGVSFPAIQSVRMNILNIQDIHNNLTNK